MRFSRTVVTLIFIGLLLSACVYSSGLTFPQLKDTTPATLKATACSPSIGLTFVPAYGWDNALQGQVMCAEAGDYYLAIYIYVSGWWSKPTFAEPLTLIRSDGRWSADITTGGIDHQATQVMVFLIPDGYNPPLMAGEPVIADELFEHAVAYSHVVRTLTAREIEFSGYRWRVKESESFAVGPGPNYFSDDEDSVWVDEEGRLHLTIRKRGEHWYASEVVATESLGYGTYTFTLGSDAQHLNENVVLGLFTWDDSAPEYNYREIDIEFSRWGETSGMNAQYVVQPWDQPGNRYRFNAELQQERSSHSFEWRKDEVLFSSFQEDGGRIDTWTYSGASVPPAGNENTRINLWLFGSVPPSNEEEVEVVIDAFAFSPAEEAMVRPVGQPINKQRAADEASGQVMAPWITVNAKGNEVWGEVGPAGICNGDYKVALYARTDKWYVQPFADSRGDIEILEDCTWHSSTHAWKEVAAFLVAAAYKQPEVILQLTVCPPLLLNSTADRDILAATCFPE